MKKITKIGIVLLSVFALSTMGPAPVMAQESNSTTMGSGPTGEENWNVVTGGSVYSSAAYADGYLYFGSYDHNLYRVEASTGNVDYSINLTGDTSGYVEGSVEYNSGTVYVPVNNGYFLKALDADTGEILWNSSIGRVEAEQAPDYGDGSVYIADHRGNITSFDAETGTQEWVFEAGSNFITSTNYEDGVIYAGTNEPAVYAIDASDGSEIWSYTPSYGADTTPIVADGNVYFGDGTTFYALDASDGSEVWTRGWGQETGGATYKDGTLYVTTDELSDTPLYALDASDGSTIWERSGDWSPSNPTYAGGNIYVGNASGSLQAFDAQNGDPLWNYSTGGTIESSPVVVNGDVFVGSTDNNFYSISTSHSSDSSGQAIAQSLRGSIASEPQPPNLTIYFSEQRYEINELIGTTSGAVNFTG